MVNHTVCRQVSTRIFLTAIEQGFWQDGKQGDPYRMLGMLHARSFCCQSDAQLLNVESFCARGGTEELQDALL